MDNPGHKHRPVSSRNIGISILLNVGITVAEAIGGMVSGSMALISDAAHNLSDVLSLVIAYLANRLSRRTATEKETFGFRRSEILAAFINSATLIIIAVIIVVEAVQRFVNPVSVSADWIIGLASASIIVNAVSAYFVRKDAGDNLNIKSVYIHLFSDLMSSFAVLAGGFAIRFFGWSRVDAILSFLIAFYLFYVTWRIFRSSFRIIMQFTPEDINIGTLACDIEAIPGVKNIHHVHVWQINEHDRMFEAHVDISEDIKISSFEEILENIRQVLRENGIDHSTIQPEFSVDDSKKRIH